MAYLYIGHKITRFFKVDVGISVETGNSSTPKNGYGWIWGIFYRKIRIWMDMDPAERGGVEWVSAFCPVKGSRSQTYGLDAEAKAITMAKSQSKTSCRKQCEFEAKAEASCYKCFKAEAEVKPKNTGH